LFVLKVFSLSLTHISLSLPLPLPFQSIFFKKKRRILNYDVAFNGLETFSENPFENVESLIIIFF
jgi:hypothetical protein